jgi:RNA polymerase II elongation factor ELL
VHVLESAPSKFRQELYKASGDAGKAKDNAEWEFAGLVNHTLTLQKAKEVSEGMEAALATMRSNMASMEQDLQARR